MAVLKKEAEKVIVLETIRGGSFEQGFEVEIRIGDRGKTPEKLIQGSLPPAPEIPRLYQQWQSIYLSGARIILPEHQITQVSSSESRRSASQALIEAMHDWMNQGTAQKLELALRKELIQSTSAQLILKTENELLQRLPWHRWSLFSEDPQLAMALYQPHPPVKMQPMHWPVRILVILGNASSATVPSTPTPSTPTPSMPTPGAAPSPVPTSPIPTSGRAAVGSESTQSVDRPDTSIDVQQDRQLIESLPRAGVKVLNQPNRQQFSDALRDRRGWDIVFFAGHSESQMTSGAAGQPDGVLHINAQDSLSLTELNKALKVAAQRGLKLLILNSCDGLGIARSIASVGLPYQVVMREPVPDQVAHAFLRYLLDSFSHGEPLHRSLRIARDRLDEGLKKDFPSASWLPVVCQHPGAQPLWWPTLLQAPPKVRWGLVSATALGLGLLLWQGMHRPRSLPLSAIALERSQGEVSLINISDTSAAEEQSEVLTDAGTAAYAAGNFEAAVARFNQALAAYPNAPEALIYLNNAQNQLEKATTVTIAVPLPMTAEPDTALEMMRGIAQAQDEINQAGGIDGIRLQVLLADDQDDPEIAQQLADAFNQDSSIAAVIGSNTSDLSLATLDRYRAGKMPVISPTSTAMELSQNTPYFFRTVPHDRAAAEALAAHALNIQGVSRAALFWNTDSRYSQSLRQAFQRAFEELGGQIVDEFELDRVGFSAERSLNLARQQQAEAIVLLPSHEVLNQALQVVVINQAELPILGGDSFYTPRTLSVGGRNVVGAVVSVAWHSGNSPDPTFPQRAAQLWNAEVNWRSAMTYDAVQAIAQALSNQLKQSAQQQVLADPRTAIYQALSDPSFEAQGASGIIRLDQEGDRAAPAQLVRVRRNPETNKVEFAPALLEPAEPQQLTEEQD